MRKLLLALFLFLPGIVYTQQTILWKITKPGNAHVSYLLGTYHLLGNTFVDSYPVIKESLASSSVLVSETILDKEEALKYFNARPSSDTVSGILSENDRAYIATYLKGHDLSKLSPGEIFATLSANYPKFKCIPQTGNDTILFDVYLQKLAKEGGKKIIALDERQLDMFRQLTAQYNWTFFKNNIGYLLKLYRSDKMDKSRCAPVLKYMSLDIDYNFSGACPSVAANDTRNSKWMQVLPGMLDRNNCFIAVGITHLTTSCGLIEQLKKSGYKVEPVEMKK